MEHLFKKKPRDVKGGETPLGITTILVSILAAHQIRIAAP